jgi:L-ascorbate metabolism protein UlaG (beta-lactamase superfamily)
LAPDLSERSLIDMNATITWLGHATMRLVLPDGRVILIDPWLEGNPACPDALKQPARCDLVVLTHGHADHVGDLPALVNRFDPVVIGTFELCNVLEAQIGKGRFSGMNTGGTQEVEGVRVSLTQAFHSSSVDSPKGPIYAGMPNGVVVGADGLAPVYHAGDTDVFSDMKLIAQLFEPKVCILPMGGYFTMGAKGAALAAEMLGPAAIIPIHYKTFPVLSPDVDAFEQALPANLRARLVVAQIGEELAWTATGIG